MRAAGSAIVSSLTKVMVSAAGADVVFPAVDADTGAGGVPNRVVVASALGASHDLLPASATLTRWRSRPCCLAPAPVEGTSITEFAVAAVVSRARDVLADLRIGWPSKAIA